MIRVDEQVVFVPALFLLVGLFPLCLLGGLLLLELFALELGSIGPLFFFFLVVVFLFFLIFLVVFLVFVLFVILGGTRSAARKTYLW